ncbi:MAG: hypothetical protein RLP09_39380 [Sandaracinaceae bacterium]
MVAVQLPEDPERAAEVRRRVEAAVRARTGLERDVDTWGEWCVLVAPASAEHPADVAFALAEACFEAALDMHPDDTQPDVAVVADVGAGWPAASAIVRLFDAAPAGHVLIGSEALRWLTPEQMERVGVKVFRTPASDRVGVFPAPPGGDFERLTRHAPAIPRYVVPTDDDLSFSTDREGFVKLEPLIGRRSVEELLTRRGLHRVLAPPQTGKSYVAERLLDAAKALGEFVALLPLDEGARSRWAPHWWRRWRASDARGLWIIDAVDEAHWRSIPIDDVLGPWLELEEADRDRLTVILFQRDDRSVAALSRSTAAKQKQWESWTLVPIDSAEARRIVRDEVGIEASGRAFETVLAHLRRVGAEGLASNPRAIRTLARLEDEAPLAEVWDRILRDLVEGPRPAPNGPATDSILDAASRLAAVMLISGEHVVADGGGASPLTWSRVFGGDSIDAARALERTSLMTAAPGGQRFREHHLAELFAARALAREELPVHRVRELVTELDGTLRADLDGVLAQMRWLAPERSELLTEAGARALRPAPAAETQEICEALRPLLEGAGSLYVSGATAARMAHPNNESWALGVYIAREEPPALRRLMLDLADAGDWRSFVGSSVEIALSEAEEHGLRTAALYFVCERGGAAELDRLRPLLTVPDPASEASLQMRAKLLEALLDHEQEEVGWVLERADSPRPHYVDSRAILIDRLAGRLDVPTAEALLTEHVAAPAEDGRFRAPVRRALLEPALRTLAAEPTWTDARVTLLVSLWEKEWIYGLHMLDLLRARLEQDAAARAALYPRVLATRVAWEVGETLRLDEDRPWLEELASGDLSERAVHDLWNLAWRDPAGEWLRARIEEAHPEIIRRWRERAQRSEEQAEAFRREQEAIRHAIAQRAREVRPLADVLREVLETESEPEIKLHRLSWVCFAEDGHRPTDVVGQFEDLPPTLRDEALSQTRALLGLASPTPTPAPSTTFPSALLHEAEAFAAALEWDGEGWLDDSLIRRWLPGVLFALHDKRLEVTSLCFDARPEAALDAALDELKKDLTRREHPVVAESLPAGMWAAPRVWDVVEASIRSADIPPDRRAPLLRTWASRAGHLPRGRARVMALGRSLATDPSADLRLHAIDVIVTLDPTEGVPLLASIQDGADLRRALASILDAFYETTEQIATQEKRWPAETVAGLAQILWTLELPKRPPDTGYGLITREDRLLELRDAVLRIATTRRVVDEDALIAMLPEEERDLRGPWLRSLFRGESVQALLARLEPARGTRWPVSDVVAHLDGPVLAPRSLEDLHELVLHLLSTDIAGTVGEHRSLFVHPESGPHERVLQEYLLMRLRDLMSVPMEGRLTIKREPEEAFGDEPDLVLFALEGEARELVVEVKWSHNDKVIPSLTEQLGQRYLLDQGRTHGIYVVGFTGQGYAERKDSARLKAALKRRRDAFLSEHPELRVDFVVLPLSRG